MQSLVTLDNSCIVVRADNITISLDPTRYISSDLAFVSHAHTDHLSKTYFRSGANKVLTSKETLDIALARGFSIGKIHEDSTMQLLNTGHILGSRGLLVNHELYYTGDISIRKRAFMNAGQIPNVKTLIIESTFGRPHYIFPTVSEIIHKANEIISRMYDHGIPVLLMGYPLGKAQLLAYLLQHWEPFYTHDSIASMNLIHRKYGVPLKDTMVFSEANEKGLLAKTKPWVMVCPVMHSGNTFVKFMKQKFGAVSVGFSGWAVDRRYRASMGFDYALPLSDHCDYSELLEVVNMSGAEKIYTFHGFAAEFANSLEKLGFKAEALSCYAKSARTPKTGRVRDKKPGVHRIDSYF